MTLRQTLRLGVVTSVACYVAPALSHLCDLEVLVADVQASGASPHYGDVVQAAWVAFGGAEGRTLDDRAVQSTYVALPDGALVPSIITRVTGIVDDDLREAPNAGDVWRRFQAEACARTPPIVVIHYARYERSFFQALRTEHSPDRPLGFEIVCTHEIARRLLPNMPRRGLRALAGYFGMGIGELRQSPGHVRATAFVWSHLLEELAERGIETLAALRELLGDKAPARGRREYPMDRSKRLSMPESPGVYRMLRSNGDVLYVGKATSLKRRVNSYFQKQRKVDERLLEMLSQARELDVTPTSTPLEAALLETDEIKRLDPPYNKALRAAGRSPWFASKDLRRWQRTYDRHHPVGPLGNTWWVSRYAAICDLLDDDDNVETLHRALGGGSTEADEEILREGWRRFREEFAAKISGRTALMFTGAVLWREQLGAVVEPDDDNDGDEDTEDEWDADKAYARFRDAIVVTAHGLRRAAWLRRIANATVAWKAHASMPGLRFVQLSAGVLVKAGTALTLADLPPQATRSSCRPLLRSLDLATYDRLRVLATEIRAISLAGDDTVVRIADRTWSGDRLRAVVAWC